MGLFNLKEKAEDIKIQFYTWLNNIFKNNLPSNIKAINFNLYDDGKNKWSIELIGAPEYNEDDLDWACNEIFTTRQSPFKISRQGSWEDIQTLFYDFITEYIENGNYADKLKFYDAIGIGFVDGDIQILYKNNT